MSDIGGIWRTVGGRRIFIKDGQDLSSAMKESGKFKTDWKENKITSDTLEEISKLANIRNEEGFKVGIEKATFDYTGANKKYPVLVTEEEFNNTNGIVIYRGDGADTLEKKQQILNDFYEGDIYIRNNNTASGTWFTTNMGVAEGYKDGTNGTTSKNSKYSTIHYAKINSNAKIINSKQLLSKKERLIQFGLKKDTSNLSKIIYDDGLYASLLGYDILEVDNWFGNSKNYAILNRNVLVVKKDDDYKRVIKK